MDDEDDTELSSEQTEILIDFQSLTGLDDLDHCRELLENSNWSKNIAAEKFFGEPETPSFVDRGMGEGSLDDYPESSRNLPRTQNFPERPTPPVSISPSSHVSYTGTPAPVERWGFMDWIKATIAFPFRFVFSSVFEIFNFVWSFFAGPRFAPSSPVQDVENFIQDFEQKYGTSHPVFYRGGYKDAYADAKKELRFLLLYLHQDNADSDRFCANTLIKPEVVSLINARTLFWACSTKFSEGYKVAQALQANRYPSLGLIACKNGQMTLVGRLQGYHSSEEFLERLNQLINANDRHLNAARLERRQLDMNQTLRKEQDEAYLRSLKADQDKERARMEEKLKKETEARRVAEETEKKEREARLQIEMLAQKKQNAAAAVPLEPKEGESEVCRVSLKMNERRLERRFFKSDTIGDLYNFILSQPDAAEHFEVFTSYPRKSIDCVAGSDRTFASLGLGNAVAFIVEEMDMEESNHHLSAK